MEYLCSLDQFHIALAILLIFLFLFGVCLGTVICAATLYLSGKKYK